MIRVLYLLVPAAAALAAGCPSPSGPAPSPTEADKAVTRERLERIIKPFYNGARQLPWMYYARSTNAPGLSWRVELLAHIGEKALYDEFRLDEPWDSEHNKRLIDRMPDVLKSPRGTAPAGRT